MSHQAPPGGSKAEAHGSPKVLRKRPQSVSLARVLVYDGGGGDTSSSNNSLNSSTSETGGGGRMRHFHLHHQHHHPAAATSEEEAAFRKLNLGSANPIFGSHHRHHHHQNQNAYRNHSSLTIPPSRGGSSSDASSTVSETNLIRVRSSALGKSAPSLSQAMVSTERHVFVVVYCAISEIGVTICFSHWTTFALAYCGYWAAGR